MAITIIVTNAGRAALVNAVNTGTNAVTITQLGITAADFAPTAAQVALPGEIKRIPLASGVVVADDQIHVTASDVTPDAYTMRGFALYLSDGTLFAIYGQAGAILNKTAQSMMLLAADIAFADIDAELIEFGDTNFVLPPATTEILGLVELATTSEAQAGVDAARVLTPLTGKQSVLGWLLSQDGSGSGLDADLLDGLHASAFALAGHTHGTMAAQNSDNVNITGGAISGTTLSNIGGAVGIACAALPSTKLQVRIGTDRRFSVFANGADNVLGYLTDAGNWADTFLNGSTLRFGIGGVERARIDTAGNLGIGATSMAGKLHVVTSGTKQTYFVDAAHNTLANQAVGMILPRPDGGATSAIISAARAGAGGGEGGIAICGRDGVTIATGGASLYSATVPRLTVTNDGKIGIGTDAPEAAVHVRGGGVGATQLRLDSSVTQPNIAFYNNSANASDRNWAIVASHTEFGDLTFRRSNAYAGDPLAAGSTMFRILANGQQLAADGNGGAPSISFINDPDTGVYANGSNSLLFATGGATRAAVDSFGRIVPNADNVQDFGWAGGRWRTGHFGTDVLVGGNAAWHSGNDGSGSGLDADLLDGQQGSYYLPAASYTAADVRTKLLTVDGAGTGIDADLLDGQHGSYYLPAATFSGAQVLSRLQTVDGSGSGLDADMLDGFHASDFRRIVDQNLSEYDGYRVWSDGTKECWTRMVINENQSKTWALPVAHTLWVHPSLAISTVAITDVQDNTGITSINGAPPYSITFWNADNRTLTLWVRTLGI